MQTATYIVADPEPEIDLLARRIQKAAAKLATPLALPHKLIDRRVSVYWAGDEQWYEATVMKVDFVNNGAPMLIYLPTRPMVLIDNTSRE
jgi:hypothetical protein